MTAYRDDAVGLRWRIEQVRARARLLEERIEDALYDWLSEASRRELQVARAEAEQRRDERDRDALLRVAQAVDRYAQLLEVAIAEAPALAERCNLLPETAPEEPKPDFDYSFPDIYWGPWRMLRKRLRAQVRARDKSADFLDARVGYYDHQLEPYLVDVVFVASGAPMRLRAVLDGDRSVHQRPHPVRLRLEHEMRYVLELRLSLTTHVRPSLPRLEAKPQGVLAAITTRIGLQRDTRLGDEVVDDALVIDAAADRIGRVLPPKARRSLSKLLAEAAVTLLRVDRGVAQLEWVETFVEKVGLDEEPIGDHRSAGLRHAIALCATIRSAAPTRLLRQQP